MSKVKPLSLRYVVSCKSIGFLTGLMTYNHRRSSMMSRHESRTREVKHLQSIGKYYITAARQANKLTLTHVVYNCRFPQRNTEGGP